MNILAIDIGNTHTKWCICVDFKNIKKKLFNIKTIYSKDLENINFGCLKSIDYVYISSVVKNFHLEILKTIFLKQKFPKDRIFYIKDYVSYIQSCYSNIMELGADRISNIIACQILFSNQAVMIVSVGTVTTIDIVNHQGKHLGGYIIPGFQLIQDSLSKIGNLPLITSYTNVLTFGDSTESCIKNGALITHIGIIKMILKNITQLKPKIVITGGYSYLLKPHLHKKVKYIPNLVLYGLLQISCMNQYKKNDHYY